MQKYLIEENLVRKINEELGIVDGINKGVKDVIRQFIDDVPELKQKSILNSNSVKESKVTLKVKFGQNITVNVIFTVLFFNNRMDYAVYRNKHEKPNPYFDLLSHTVNVEVEIINGRCDILTLEGVIQHEVHHAYQEICKNKNNMYTEKNTPLYQTAKRYINDDNIDIASAARAIYLWGTNETSAYGNNLYVELMNAFQYDGHSNYTIQDTISKNQMYIMRKYISLLLNKLSNNSYVDMEKIEVVFGISRKKLKSICKMTLEKIDHVITKITTKAKIDYDKEISEYSDSIEEITDNL